MINLLGAVLDKSPIALTIECTNGIMNEKGNLVCNVTRKSGVPYYLLEFEEVVDGKVINHGYSMMFGNIKRGEVYWDFFGPSAYQKTLKTGKHSFRRQLFSGRVIFLLCCGCGLDVQRLPFKSEYLILLKADLRLRVWEYKISHHQ